MALLIAEVKPRSPFGYRSDKTRDRLLDQALAAEPYAISIHTEPRFGGDYEWLRWACTVASGVCPVLAKGIHWTDESVQRCFDAGAAWVLTVGRDTGHPMCWYEPTRKQRGELGRVYSGAGDGTGLSGSLVVINDRSLETGELAAQVRHAPRYRGAKIVQASGIRTPGDVWHDAWACIVGEHLTEYVAASDR